MSRQPKEEAQPATDVSPRGGRKVTINDIASLAGVSKKTVSRVINKSPLVRENTRIRVQEIIRETGFVPDPQARALAFRRSFLVGMIYNNPSPQYVVSIQRGILDALDGTDNVLVLQPCDRSNPDLMGQISRFVQQQKPSGVILTPSISEDEKVAQLLRELECPYIRIASVPVDESRKMVRTHDHEGARQAALHLADIGHTRIGHVHGPETFRSTHERRRGFEEGLAERGLHLAEAYRREGAYTHATGLECTKQLLTLKDRPTAIFLGNEEMAFGAYQAARELGLSIPDDISIVGYDDTPMATRVWPEMTTVRVPIREIGAHAAKLLIHDGDEDALLENAEIFPELILRGSTKPL